MVDQFKTFGHQRGCILGDENLNQMGILTNPLNVQTDNQLTAFGELVVGELHPQFQGSFEYTVSNTDLNGDESTGGGSVSQASGMAVVATSTTPGSTGHLDSKQHARYKAGIGGSMRFTALFTSPVANTEQYAGIPDTEGSSAAFMNGYLVGYDGVTFGFHRFQNDVKFTVAQAEWDDPMDGTGVSGMILDQTKLNVYSIQYQYLGAGAIRLFIESDTTGLFVLVHTVHYANKNIEPSVHNPNFHFALYVANKATSNNMIVKSSSYAYFVEGKTSFIELHQPENASGRKQKTLVTTETSIFTIRNKAIYASKTNFIDVLLLLASGSIEASSANNLGDIRVVKNATLGGSPSYSDINTTNSVIEFDVDGTTVTGGTELATGLLAGKNAERTVPLIDNRIILSPGDTLTLAGSSENSATIRAQASWRELF